MYHQLEHRGFIYFIKGNQRMQITTDKIIYFYKIDEVTLIPHLENCMYNFMGCSQMMFGTRQLYSLTYKSGQSGFNIYKKKYLHKFLVTQSDQSYQWCFGLAINPLNQYLVAYENKIQVLDQTDFSIKQELMIPIDEYVFYKNRKMRVKLISMQVADD